MSSTSPARPFNCGDAASAASPASSALAVRTVCPWWSAPQVGPISRWQNRHSSPDVNCGTGRPTWSLPQAAGSSCWAGSRSANRTSSAANTAGRRKSGIRPHPSVGRVGALSTLAQIGLLELAQRVRGKRLPPGRNIDAVNLRRIEPKNLCLVLFRQLLVAELLAQLVGDLEPLEGLDHPLRRAPPETIRAPDDVVGPKMLNVLAHQVLAHDRVLNRQAAEG